MTPSVRKRMAKQLTWIETLRLSLKQSDEVMKGLTVQEGRGYLKIHLRNSAYGEGRKTFKSVRWTKSNQAAIVEVCKAVTRLMLPPRSRSFEEACSAVDNPATSRGDVVNWGAVVESVFEANSGWRDQTASAQKTRFDNFLALMNSADAPKDSRQVVRSYAKKYFGNSAPGGDGRRRHMKACEIVLERAVNHFAANECWRASDGDFKQLVEDLIGTPQQNTAENKTPPIKDPELSCLLDALRDASPELYLAVGLVALYGLRPAELAAMEPNDFGELTVWNNTVKRNKQTMRQPAYKRLVSFLDVPGREGEAEKLWNSYTAGLVKLPPSLVNAIAKAKRTHQYKPVGDCFRQLLDRSKVWKNLLEATPGVVPYSLRHSYAWRGHMDYGVEIRPLAKSMGHDPTTHQKHYGAWIDNDEQRAAFGRARGRQYPAETATSRYI